MTKKKTNQKIISKKDAQKTHRWASKFIRTIERAHKQAAKSKLVFKCGAADKAFSTSVKKNSYTNYK